MCTDPPCAPDPAVTPKLPFDNMIESPVFIFIEPAFPAIALGDNMSIFPDAWFSWPCVSKEIEPLEPLIAYEAPETKSILPPVDPTASPAFMRTLPPPVSMEISPVLKAVPTLEINFPEIDVLSLDFIRTPPDLAAIVVASVNSPLVPSDDPVEKVILPPFFTLSVLPPSMLMGPPANFSLSPARILTVPDFNIPFPTRIGIWPDGARLLAPVA